MQPVRPDPGPAGASRSGSPSSRSSPARSPGPSATTAPSSTPTSAASSRRRTPSAAAGSRSSTTWSPCSSSSSTSSCVFLYPFAVAFDQLALFGARRDGASCSSITVFVATSGAGRARVGLRMGAEPGTTRRRLDGNRGEAAERLPADTVENLVGYMRKSSVWPATFGLACCAIEMMAVGGPEYDIARFGMERLPRLAAAGRPDDRRRPRQPEDGAGGAPDLRPDGRAQVGLSMGVCASSGGMFNNYAIVQGVDHVVPVDIYLPGCPPRPEMLINAILELHEQIQHDAARRQPHHAPPGRRGGRAGGGADLADEGAARMSDRTTTTPRQTAAEPARSPSAQPTARGDARTRRPAAPRAAGHRPRPSARRASASRAGHVRRPRHRRHLRLRRPGPHRGPAAGATARPYGGWFDEAADVLAEVLRPSDGSRARLDGAIEKVVVDRGELTLFVRREHLLRGRAGAARRRRTCGSRCASGVTGVHYPDDAGPRAARRLPPAVDHPQPPAPPRGRLPGRRPAHPVDRRGLPDATTGTSGRPGTSSASSSTATRR